MEPSIRLMWSSATSTGISAPSSNERAKPMSTMSLLRINSIIGGYASDGRRGRACAFAAYSFGRPRAISALMSCVLQRHRARAKGCRTISSSSKLVWRHRTLGVVVSLDEGRSDPEASLSDLVSLVAGDMDRVNAMILSRTGSDVTMIPEVANHLISSGGKRLRPMLTLATAGLCGYRGRRRT